MSSLQTIITLGWQPLLTSRYAAPVGAYSSYNAKFRCQRSFGLGFCLDYVLAFCNVVISAISGSIFSRNMHVRGLLDSLLYSLTIAGTPVKNNKG